MALINKSTDKFIKEYGALEAFNRIDYFMSRCELREDNITDDSFKTSALELMMRLKDSILCQAIREQKKERKRK